MILFQNISIENCFWIWGKYWKAITRIEQQLYQKGTIFCKEIAFAGIVFIYRTKWKIWGSWKVEKHENPGWISLDIDVTYPRNNLRTENLKHMFKTKN